MFLQPSFNSYAITRLAVSHKITILQIKAMKFKLIILWASVYLKWVATQDLKHHLVADENGMYHLFWSVDDQNITFEVQVATKGYVGFGFSPNGGMPGSDIVIGWVLPNGQAYFHDRHAIGFFEPLIDTEQNYNLINAYENDTHTVLRFTRKLNTCDKDNDIIITDSTMKMIYSWHPEDPETTTGVPYHGSDRRGSKNYAFLSPPISPYEITNGITIWDIQMPNITIPSKDTTYYCFGVKLPSFEEPHYYVGYTAELSPGNEDLVHHLALTVCVGNFMYYKEKYEQIQNPYDCTYPEKYSPENDCSTQFIIWGVGGQGQFLPKGVGWLLGEEYGGPSYFLARAHYNNIDKKKGIVDSSKIHVYLSRNGITSNSGVFMMRAKYDYTLVIPPQQPGFKISTYWPSEYTSISLPKEGINVFGVAGHTHLLGTKTKIRHFRDNQELKPILEENNYYFDYQEIRNLPETVKIMPGDMLMGTCVYSTMEQNETILGGPGTTEEMCAFQLNYYPTAELSQCTANPNYQEIFQYFGVNEVAEDKVHIISPVALQNRTMHDVIKHYDWTAVDEAKMKKLMAMQYDAVKNVTCSDALAMTENSITIPVSYPIDVLPYIPPRDVCAFEE